MSAVNGVNQSSIMSGSGRPFKLVHSQNIRELGSYTQVDTIEGRYDQRSKQIIECVRPDQLLPPDIIFPDLRMYPQAKHTDIIYPGMFGHGYFALSPKALSVLSLNLNGQSSKRR